MIYLVLAIFVKRNWINKYIGAGKLGWWKARFPNRETVFSGSGVGFRGRTLYIFVHTESVFDVFFESALAIYEGW